MSGAAGALCSPRTTQAAQAKKLFQLFSIGALPDASGCSCAIQQSEHPATTTANSSALLISLVMEKVLKTPTNSIFSARSLHEKKLKPFIFFLRERLLSSE